MTHPKITIVTPVYNGERHIGETIRAIQAQTVGDYEHLVVDDCSRDGTAALVQAEAEADHRIIYMRSPSNFGGPAGPRNIGIDAARGEWVAFCDADDLWVPTKLETQLAVAARSDGVLYCSGVQDFHDGTAPPAPRDHEGEAGWDEISLKKMMLKNWIAMSSVMARRETLIAAGLFNVEKSHVAVEDYDLWIRIIDSTGKPAIRVDRPLVFYRRVPQSISAGKWMMLNKAMMVQAKLHKRRGNATRFALMRPIHMGLYIATSLWMRSFKGQL